MGKKVFANSTNNQLSISQLVALNQEWQESSTLTGIEGASFELNNPKSRRPLTGRILSASNQNKGYCLEVMLDKSLGGSKKHYLYVEEISEDDDWHFRTKKFYFRFVIKNNG